MVLWRWNNRWYVQSYCIHACNQIICFTGENKPYYSVFPATIRTAGCYYCQVKNQYGVVKSPIVTVIVTTSLTAGNSSVSSGFSYIPLIKEESTTLLSNKGVIMQQTQDLQS